MALAICMTGNWSFWTAVANCITIGITSLASGWLLNCVSATTTFAWTVAGNEANAPATVPWVMGGNVSMAPINATAVSVGNWVTN